MNIPAEEPDENRKRPNSPGASRNSKMTQCNDLNAPFGCCNIRDGIHSVVSNEDNTQYPTANHFGTHRRKAMHQSTISSFVHDIEETKRCNEIEILNAGDEDDTSSESVTTDESETHLKTPYNDNKEPVNLRTTRRSRAHRQYVQHGDDNIMFIYEPKKEPQSVKYYKQVGNKNIMVHLNVNSNFCQLVDKNDGIIPLDLNGEVWLEIKRRSRVRGEHGGTPTETRQDSRNLFVPDTNDLNLGQCTNEIIYERSSPTENTEVKHVRTSPTENSDSLDTLSDFLDDDGGHYSTISIQEETDALQIKFGKCKQDCVLDIGNLDSSAILSHKKVLDFLTDKGNDFDVTIHDWEYEKESIYSYIPSTPIDRVSTGYYYLGYESLTSVPRVRSVDEHSLASSIITTISPEEHEAMYPLPKQRTNNAIPNPTLPTEKYKRPLPELPEQSKSSGTVCTINCKSRPMPQPRNNKNEADIPLPARQFRSPRNLDPFKIQPIRENPPPLPLRSPTSPQYSFQAGIDTPPPLPDRPPGPLRQESKQAEQLPTNRMRIPSPRERRELKLPPPPGFTDTNNLLKCVWYHGKLEPGSGKEVLANEQHGSFLVRDSNNNTENHKYTIEFRDGSEIKKLMIVKTNDKYHFSEFKSKTFSSVVEMVETIISIGLEVKDTDTQCWKTIQVKPAAKYKPT